MSKTQSDDFLPLLSYKIALTNEPGDPFLCPVSHLCALALADNAFLQVKSMSDLNKVREACRIKKTQVNVRRNNHLHDVPCTSGCDSKRHHIGQEYYKC